MSTDTALDVDKLIENADNKRVLLDIARDANGYDGEFEDLAAHSMDELDEILDGMAPSDIINKIAYGEWNPSDDYFRFNGYGNLESVNEYDLLDDVWDQRKDIINWVNDNPNETQCASQLDFQNDED